MPLTGPIIIPKGGFKVNLTGHVWFNANAGGRVKVWVCAHCLERVCGDTYPGCGICRAALGGQMAWTTGRC